MDLEELSDYISQRRNTFFIIIDIIKMISHDNGLRNSLGVIVFSHLSRMPVLLQMTATSIIPFVSVALCLRLGLFLSASWEKKNEKKILQGSVTSNQQPQSSFCCDFYQRSLSLAPVATVPWP